MTTPLLLSRARVRIFADSDLSSAPFDARTKNVPFFYAKADVQFEFGLGWRGDLIDAGNLASLVIELRAMGTGNGVPPSATAIALTKTVAEITARVLERDWRNGDDQHALFAFLGGEGGETDIPPGNYWMSVYAWTKDDPALKIPFQPGPLRVLSDGSGAPGSAPAPGLSYAVNLPNVSSITATDASGLAGQLTAKYPLKTMFSVCCPDDGPGGLADDVMQFWRLEATTAANAAGVRQRGSDYHGSTNARAFVRRG